VGKLVQSCSDPCAVGDYVRIQSYDGAGRPHTATLTIGGGAETFTQEYEADTGRVATLEYPSGLKVQYNYNARGYVTSITDFTSHAVLWTANARDAEMHLIQQTLGNAVGVWQAFDARTGMVSQIRPSSDGTDDGSLTTFGYAFDSHGNLQNRSDAVANGLTPYTENLCYDPLNRLVNASVRPLGGTSCTAGASAKTFAYDDVGNLTSKTQIGATGSNLYSYPAPGPTSVRPHAVSAIAGTVNGTVNPLYKYDANGNLTCIYTSGNCSAGVGVTIATWRYTAANMVSRIVEGAVTIRLTYDSEHGRITQHTVNGAVTTDTTYVNDPMSGALSELVSTGTGPATWKDYLIADGNAF
jgi:YD repeat-containing protein